MISYRQTIFAYPSGGGAYIVSRENLGETPALVAGASLLVDYILTVAVSVSAGVAALYSAFGGLKPFAVPIALIVAYGVARVLAQAFGELRDAIFAPVSQRAIRTLALEVQNHADLPVSLGIPAGARTSTTVCASKPGVPA